MTQRASWILIVWLAGLSGWMAAADAQQPSATPPSKENTYLLSCAADGTAIEINVVERGAVKQNVSVDVAGLRLWVDNAESQRRIRARIADPAAASRLVLASLTAKLRETGIEPDMVPVRGEEGKKMGRDGMVLLEAGEYVRPGVYYDSSGGGFTRLPDGSPKPSHGDKYRVRVSAFYIDKYKVTNEDYCKFLNDSNAGYATPWNPVIVRSTVGWPVPTGQFMPAARAIAKHPVASVNWYQAKGYAAWAGKRLPTEAQWEYAAGGKHGFTYPWGNEPPDETRANFPVKFRHTLPVDMYPAGATPEGVFQMAGNAGEWCADFYDHSYGKAPAGGVLVDPKGAAQGFQPNEWYKFNVVFKGWCKPGNPEHLTGTKRHGRHPLVEDPEGLGIRCVKGCT